MHEEPADDDTLSALDRAVIDLLRAPVAERAMQLAALQAAGGDLANRVRHRLSTLGEYGLLELPDQEVPVAPLPSSIGGYRILRLLGSGGMGVVYLAEQPDLRKPVALKVLHGWRLCSARARERFRREALIAARLDHPSLCPVLEVGEADGVPFLAMRYVPGKPLDRLIDEARAAGRSCVQLGSSDGTTAVRPGSGEHRSSCNAAVALVERVARAIDVAHQRGLVHRDLKPGNIVVEPEGTPVVLDFGLARDESEEGLTLSGDHVGTPAYMAPEQVGASGLRVDARTDVYALGVVLYECLRLELPCAAADRESLYRATLRGSAANAARRQRRLDRDLRVVLATAMDPDPERRYASALLFAQDLERYRRREPILARPASPLLRARRWTQRNPALAAALALLAVGLGATSMLSYQRGLALRHSRSVELAQVSRLVQPRNTLRAHLLALAGVEAEPNLETISQLHATTVDVRECAQLDHEGVLHMCCWSPDGSRLLTASDDGRARLWDSRGKLLKELPHTDAPDHGRNARRFDGLPVPVALFASDGRIVTADNEGIARLWSPDGQSPFVLYKDPSRRRFLKGLLHRESGLLLLVGHGGLAVCWRHLGEEPIALDCTKSLLATCAVAPDGARIGFAVNYAFRPAADADFRAFVWRPAEQRMTELRGHEASIMGMAFREDGVLTVSQDSTLRCWNDDGKELWQRKHPTRVVALAVAPDGRTIATADAVGDLWMWDGNGAPEGRVFRQHSQFQRIAWSADGHRMVIAGNDGMGLMLDAEGHVLDRFSGHGEMVVATAWSPDQRHVLTASGDQTARIWRAEGELPALHGHRAGVRCLALSPDGTRLLSGSNDGTVRVCTLDEDGRAGEPVVIQSQEPLFQAQVIDVAWHPKDSGEALVCTVGQVATRVVADTGNVRQQYRLGSGFRSLEGAYTPDGQYLLLGGRIDQKKPGVRLVDLRDDSERILEVTKSIETTALAIDRDGTRYAAAEWTGRVVLADLNGRELADLSLDKDRVSKDRVNSLAFSPVDNLLLAGCNGRSVRLWNVAHDAPVLLHELRGHEAAVTAVAWARDGTHFASASFDGTARLWSRTGEPLAILRGHEGIVWDVEFSANGRQLFTAGEDRVIRRWFVDAGELMAVAKRLAFRPFTDFELQQYGPLLR